MLLEQQGGSTTATYTYSNSLIRKDGETPLFDGLGSERTVTNSGQGVMGSLTLSAFGQSVASSGSSTSAYGFGATSGYRSDGDAGLTLVGCRFYDAQVGRFITCDTYLDQKPYAYCDGDPVDGVDPSGHIEWGNLPTIAKIGLRAFSIVGIFDGLVLAGGSIYDTIIDSNAVATMKEQEQKYEEGKIGKNGGDPEADHTAAENDIRLAEGKALKSAAKAVGDSQKAIYSLK